MIESGSQRHTFILYIKSSTPRFHYRSGTISWFYLETSVWPIEKPNSGIFMFSTRFPRGIIPCRKGYSMKPLGDPLTSCAKTL